MKYTEPCHKMSKYSAYSGPFPIYCLWYKFKGNITSDFDNDDFF